MATVPEDENDTGETFAEAFPDFVRNVVTGKPTGAVSIVVLFCVIAICLAFAPLPATIVGVTAVLLLNQRWKWDK